MKKSVYQFNQPMMFSDFTPMPMCYDGKADQLSVEEYEDAMALVFISNKEERRCFASMPFGGIYITFEKPA